MSANETTYPQFHADALSDIAERKVVFMKLKDEYRKYFDRFHISRTCKKEIKTVNCKPIEKYYLNGIINIGFQSTVNRF